MDASTTHETTESVNAAGRSLSAHLLFWTVAGLLVGLDLWSKHRVFEWLETNEIRTIIPGVIDFRRSLNAGAVFGSFSGHGELFIGASLAALGFVFYLFVRSAGTHRVLHAALAMILAGALGNLYDRSFVIADVVIHHSDSGAEELIIGSIVGDPNEAVIRIGDWPEGSRVRSFARSEVTVRRQGVVRDFIKFVPRFPSWVPGLGGRDVWPWVFNVADAALVCGVGVLLISTWTVRRHR